MQRKSFADVECNIARSVEEVGDGWSLMILRNALLGARRFQDFAAQLDVPPTTLARRLSALTARGFFVRREYAAHPPREEYELTAKGLDFLPVLLALAAWGERWLSPGSEPHQYDPLRVANAKELRRYDEFILFALAAADEAIADAGWKSDSDEASERAGVLI